MRMSDPYVSKQLHTAYRHGIADYLMGVYQIVVGLAGLVGLATVFVARYAMNRSAKKYLIAKKRLPVEHPVGPVFAMRAEHPHKRSDLQLPEWKPIETPSTLQDRGAE